MEDSNTGGGEASLPAEHFALMIDVRMGRVDKQPRWTKAFREFVETDEKKLRETLIKFNFVVSNIHVGSVRELNRELEHASSTDYSRYASFLMVISGYGMESPQFIRCSDGNMPKETIIDKYFKGKQCPSLVGKAKLFLVQACDHPAYKIASNCSGEGHDGEKDDKPKEYVDVADIMSLWSSVPGYVTWRTDAQGSMTIDYFCQQLNNCAVGESLTIDHNLLSRVVSDVNDELEAHKAMPEHKRLPKISATDTFNLQLCKLKK